MTYNLNEQVVDMNTQQVGKVVEMKEENGSVFYRVDFDGIQKTLSEGQLAYFLTE